VDVVIRRVRATSEELRPRSADARRSSTWTTRSVGGEPRATHTPLALDPAVWARAVLSRPVRCSPGPLTTTVSPRMVANIAQRYSEYLEYRGGPFGDDRMAG